MFSFQTSDYNNNMRLRFYITSSSFTVSPHIILPQQQRLLVILLIFFFIVHVGIVNAWKKGSRLFCNSLDNRRTMG